MSDFSIFEDDRYKVLKSPNYNYKFNKQTGFFVRYGETEDDDPEFCPFGPEILDIEVSTICHGIGKPCKHCYKSNTGKGKNMRLGKFKKIFNKMPKTLTQIAFGIGDISSNPDLFKMFEYCRNNDYNQVVPNITINGWGLTDEQAEKFASLCGAVAVSRYENKDVCYNAVEKLIKAGLKQVNIHHLVSKETYLSCFETIEDACKEFGDERLSGLNAIVFLMLKNKGRGMINFFIIVSLIVSYTIFDFLIRGKKNG
jgi:hypothetical protein